MWTERVQHSSLYPKQIRIAYFYLSRELFSIVKIHFQFFFFFCRRAIFRRDPLQSHLSISAVRFRLYMIININCVSLFPVVSLIPPLLFVRPLPNNHAHFIISLVPPSISLCCVFFFPSFEPCRSFFFSILAYLHCFMTNISIGIRNSFKKKHKRALGRTVSPFQPIFIYIYRHTHKKGKDCNYVTWS